MKIKVLSKNIVFLILLIMIINISFSGCLGSDQISKINKKPLLNKKIVATNINKTEEIVYKNKKLGFALTFPASWKGKYMIEEKEDGISVYQYINPKLKISKKVGFFNIYEYGTKKQWDKTFSDPNNMNGAPFEKVGIINNIVYTSFEVDDIKYDTNIYKENKAAEEYAKLAISSDDILKSFRELKNDN